MTGCNSISLPPSQHTCDNTATAIKKILVRKNKNGDVECKPNGNNVLILK